VVIERVFDVDIDMVGAEKRKVPAHHHKQYDNDHDKRADDEIKAAVS